MKQAYLTAVAALLILMAACTKSDTSTLEHNDIIRDGRWKMTAYTMHLTDPAAGRDTVMDLFRLIDTCRMDDYLTFNTQYDGTLNTSTRKCGAQANELKFKWELRDNQNVLMLNDLKYLIGNVSEVPYFPAGLDYVEAQIKRMNKASFVITYGFTEIYKPMNHKVTYSFTQTFTKM